MTTPLLPPPVRPWPIRGFNAVGRGLRRLGKTGRTLSFSIDTESVLTAASRQTGLQDFGDDSFRPGLERLTQSLEEDGRLTAFGRFFARRQLLELLTHRLRIVDWRGKHPEVAEQRIERPIFITGLPRTGTTILHALLSEDPAHRSPLSWEVDEPCPPARAESYETDPRIERTRKRFDQLHQLAPDFQRIHPIGEQMPQECIVLTASHFMSLRFEMCFDVGGYQRWLFDQDMTPAYDFHRQFLQHMQSGMARERWVLKSPGHLGPLDALFSVYPDALVVQTHRDPLRVVPSVASLEYAMRQVSSDDLRPQRLGRQMLWLWSSMLEQGMASRRAHPEREGQILDLHMAEIAADPVACVARIYDRFGLAFGSVLEERLRRFVAAHPRDEHGVHRYGLEAFGLSEPEIRDAFKGYCEHFGVEREPF